MVKSITIEIDEQGASSIDLAGFQGKGCAEIVAEFQGADTVTVKKRKPEYNVMRATVQQAQK